MLSATLKILGVSKSIKMLEKARQESRRKARRALTKGSFIVIREAKHRCPVDTGRLRSSITHQIVSDQLAKVGTNVHYGDDVEFGIGQRAQPFLGPALVDKRDEVLEAFRKEMSW